MAILTCFRPSCLAIISSLLLTACATTPRVKVSTDYDKNAGFQQIRTYDWYQEQPAKGYKTRYPKKASNKYILEKRKK